jgi:phospholipase/carboxylesterase
MKALHLQGNPLENDVVTTGKVLIIFFHGWGADGDNLLDLGTVFQNHIPESKCCYPSAAFPTEMNSGGRAWFTLYDANTGKMLPNDILQKNISKALPPLVKWIKELQKTKHVSYEKTFLVGFSQGAMMALYLGLNNPKLARGIIAYSGSLLGKKEWDNVDAETAYLLVHGEQDMVVPVTELYAANRVLKNYNLNYQELVISDLEHSINEEAVLNGLTFIKKELAKK